MRSEKTINGVTAKFEYVGDKLFYEKRGDRDIYYRYNSFGNLSGITYYNGSTEYTYYVLCNSRGDVETIYNGTGTLVAKYIYDAWGNIISITDANNQNITDPNHVGNINPIRYRGYYYDAETGLFYVGSRYYDPEIGRFINADGYVQTPNGDLSSTNMFTYCGNNPVNNIDPTGEFFLTATIGGTSVWLIGALLVGLVATYVITDTLVKNPPVLPPISLPEIKIESKVEAKPKTKDIAPTLPKPPRKDPVHHIVAKVDPRAAESRQILRDVGIEPITAPRNLMALPQSYHASLHTTAYHNYVTERLRPVAGNKAGVEATLDSLRAEILVRSAAGIRWD